MSESITKKIERKPLPASEPSAKVTARGKGNWHNAVERRVKPDTAGMQVPDAARGTVVRKADADRGTADIAFSPAADNAVGAVVRAAAEVIGDSFDKELSATSVIAAASVWAKNRGSRRVWDIDVAAAVGYDWTPEGARSFRQAHALPTNPAAPWPKRVNETPDEHTARGPIVDPLTGRVA